MSNIYPGGDAQYSTNLGLALWGADEVVVENFLLIDAAVGSGSSVKVNGATVSNPNFNGTLPAAPGGNTNITFQVSGSSVSAYVPTAVAGVTSITGDSVVYNNAASTGAVTLSLIAQTANLVFAGPTSAGPTAPTFRALVSGDIPALAYIPTSLMTTLGDTIYGGASGVATRLAGNTTATREFLTSAGVSSAATAPTWGALVSGDIPNNAANTSGTAANLSGTPALPNGTTATTQTTGDNTADIATDAFVNASIAAYTPAATKWNSIGAPTGSLTLAVPNGDNTTFNSAEANTVPFTFSWVNTQAGTSATTNPSPTLVLGSFGFAGSTSTEATWTIGATLAATATGTSTLSITPAGGGGSNVLSTPATCNFATGVATSGSVPSVTVGGVASGLGIPGSGYLGLFSASSTAGFQFIMGGTQQAILAYTTASSTLSLTARVVNSNLLLSGYQTTQTNFPSVTINNGGAANNSFTGTAGTQICCGVAAGAAGLVTFAPTTGYASFEAFQINPTINNTATGPAISSAVITSATVAAVTIPSTTGFVTGASVTIANVSTAGFTGLNGTWVVASGSSSTVLNLTTTGLSAKSQAACNGNVSLGAWNPTFGAYSALTINAVETAVIAGVNNSLIDCYTGSAGTTSVYRINNKGVSSVYNGIATVSNGVPSELAKSDLTAQSAAITATTLYATTATGMYRVSWSATITTPDGVSSVLGGAGGFQVLYTSPTDSVVKTTVSGNSVTSTANTTGTAVGGCEVVYAKTGTNIQFQYGYTSATSGQMVFEIHIKVEAM